MAEMKFTRAAALARLDRIQELLRQQPATVHEIADAVFISRRYAEAYVQHLRDRGLVHIREYRRQVRETYQTFRAIYAWGPGKDAAVPDRSPAVRQQERRAKIAKDVEAKARELAQRRAKSIKPHTDWTSAWIPRRVGE